MARKELYRPLRGGVAEHHSTKCVRRGREGLVPPENSSALARLSLWGRRRDWSESDSVKSRHAGWWRVQESTRLVNEWGLNCAKRDSNWRAAARPVRARRSKLFWGRRLLQFLPSSPAWRWTSEPTDAVDRRFKQAGRCWQPVFLEPEKR